MVGKIYHNSMSGLTYFFGSGGAIASIVGAFDLNSLQVLVGILIALVAAVCGAYRDHMRNGHIEQHAEASRRRNEEWEAWAVAYRIKKLEETGKDPFEDGIPQMVFAPEIKQPAPG